MKRLDSRSDTASINSSAALAIIGFIVVACMLSTNNIVARANAGEIPPFSLAFFRWMTAPNLACVLSLDDCCVRADTVRRSRNKRKVVGNFSTHMDGGGGRLLRHVTLRRPRLCGCCYNDSNQYRANHGCSAGERAMIYDFIHELNDPAGLTRHRTSTALARTDQANCSQTAKLLLRSVVITLGLIGPAMAEERVLISSDWGEITAELVDNNATRSLVQMLPLTIEMRDHLRQEKTGNLPAPLPAIERQLDFSAGTLGLWSSNHFVIYYRDGRVPEPGIIILGQVTGDVSIFDRSGPVTVRLERIR